MTRRELREQIFKLLFRIEFHNSEELPEQLALQMDSMEDIKDEDRAYIETKAEDIRSKLEEIDTLINEKAEKWKTTRMGKAELAIIRLAVYEMKYEEDIPVSVAINEAVELAKNYGADQAPSFVNGILAKLA